MSQFGHMSLVAFSLKKSVELCEAHKQNTDTQKALFLTPSFEWNSKKLNSKTPPLFVDSFRIVNSKAVVMNKKEAAANITYLEQRLNHTDELIKLLGDSLSVYSKKYQISASGSCLLESFLLFPLSNLSNDAG